MAEVAIDAHSGDPNPTAANFRVLKAHQYTVVTGFAITGEAPKEFISLYTYSDARKLNMHRWPLFIAKTAKKWYPAESIIEYLNGKTGELLGLNMSEGRLVIANGQLRFLSRYFLKKDEELMHGANILAGYLSDHEFVKLVRDQRKEPEFFTVQTIRTALTELFPKAATHIYTDFIRMLLFDAFLGVNDRHHYNWGVIRNLKNPEKVCFSPIYDSARSMFWNRSDSKIVSLLASAKNLNKFLEEYASKSHPKVGWDGIENLSHFDLVSKLCLECDVVSKEEIITFFSSDNYQRVRSFIKESCKSVLSQSRLQLIDRYLEVRENLFKEMFRKL